VLYEVDERAARLIIVAIRKKDAVSPGISHTPRSHAARSSRLSAVARCTLRSKYA
jgi:hypothetical protein